MRIGNVGHSNRHQRLAGSALADDDRRSRCFEMLGDTRDSQGLSWKRLPQERLNCWRKRIVWPLQRRVHLDDTCPEFLRESSKIFVIAIHGGTPEDGSEPRKKRPGSPAVQREGSGIVADCCGYRVRRGSLYTSLVTAKEDAFSACLIVYLGQSTGPFFSGNGSSPRDRARPILASNSSRVPWITAGVQPIPSSR